MLVGHTTLIRGDGPLVVGEGPVRTGVTIVVPHEDHVWTEPVFAGCHRLNGNGELTGLEWVRESGMLGGVIGITNTHSVGVVRDALVAHAARENRGQGVFWSLPVVGETYDGALNDIDGFHVKAEHVDAALAAAIGRARGRGQRRRRDGDDPATSSRAGSGRRRGSSPTRTAAGRWARWSRPTTARASCCGSTACRWARRSP